MGDRTKIEWTRSDDGTPGATWNPVTGCTKVSAGCDNCYAEKIAHRFAGTTAYPNGFEVTLRPERLDQPLRWKRPRRIFVNSMSDLFHDDVPESFIGSVFDVMAKCPQHTFQILTKRHARMRSLLTKWATQVPDDLPQYKAAFRAHQGVWAMVRQWPLPNVWLGVSTENQRSADIRIPALLDTPAAVRFISAEPLLGPIDLHADPIGKDSVFWIGHLDWVIVGGESGPGARPMHPDWARSLRDQCRIAGVPFLFKQWGEYRPVDPDIPDNRCTSDYLVTDTAVVRIADHTGPAPDGFATVRRVGKKRAGRELDGRTWDQYPEVSRG
ncbi:hypothetical protein VC60_gp69 [Mycobacterium phage Sbash]|uniref:Phage Gp37/Gp68 family protein n=1 Tax=Mycobacterium phage Sbash TaxID=1567475 RepID=A0A0A7RVQ8_9CAUD|nr:hypothetical protein VC60_gp69 [Mycobacterium phage Sbash]AJA43370.1 hypothetical protein PBI_SBASH_69 [Mycobacterium phage Sbash]